MTINAPRLEELLNAHFDTKASFLHTVLICKVTAYDPLLQTVDLQPQTKQLIPNTDGGLTAESLPNLPSVRLALSRAGSWFMSFPIAVGNFLIVLCSERDIDNWLTTGMESSPDSVNTHTLQGAIVLPCGPYPDGQSLTSVHASNIVIGKDLGTQVHIKDGEVALGSENPVSYVALATLADARISALETKVNELVALTIANAAAFAAHTNGGFPTVGTLATATPLVPGSSVAATVTKAD